MIDEDTLFISEFDALKLGALLDSLSKSSDNITSSERAYCSVWSQLFTTYGKLLVAKSSIMLDNVVNRDYNELLETYMEGG